MKSFQEYAFEKATEQIFSEVGAMLGQMGKAAIGGMLQSSMGQNLNVKDAIQDPFQNRIAQNVQNNLQNNDSFSLKNNPQYKKFLTGQSERTNAINQWMQRPQNTQGLNQHYQGNANRWKQDFQNVAKSWVSDDSQSPASFSQYATKQLGLPPGTLN